MPTHIISDNASTFTAASDEIAEVLRANELQDFLAINKVTWTFIPKRAPWFGDFYERLFGITKNSLRKTLGKASVTFDEMQTVVVQAESIISDRPLITITDGPDDSMPLTPSYLLYGRALTPLPSPSTNELDLKDESFVPSPKNANKRLQYAQLLFAGFWRRWRDEYLPLLRERNVRTASRRVTETHVIKIGDIVLLESENEKRIHWPLAQVTRLIVGSDGHVRSATLKTRDGMVNNRPIVKLYPLELTADFGKANALQPTKDLSDRTDTTRPTRRAANEASEESQMQGIADT